LGVLEKLTGNDIELPKRRAVRHKEYLKKILKEFDCTDILEEVFHDKLDADEGEDLKFDRLESLETNLVKSYDNFGDGQATRSQIMAQAITDGNNQQPSDPTVKAKNLNEPQQAQNGEPNKDAANIFNLNNNDERYSARSQSNQYTSFGGTNGNRDNRNQNSIINPDQNSIINPDQNSIINPDQNSLVIDEWDQGRDSGFNKNVSLRQCINWRAHLDSVRSLTFCNEHNLLLSVGDDCLTRLAYLSNNIVENVINSGPAGGEKRDGQAAALSQDTLVKNSSY
jgi:hypothetical protein